MSLTTAFRALRDGILIRRRRRYFRRRIRSLAPKYVLTREQEEQIQAFYRPYGKVDTWFHNFYFQKTGEFRVDYLPEDLYYCRIDPHFNDWHEGTYLDNKCYYRRMFQGVRQPEELAARVGGMWFTGDYAPISREALGALLAKEPEIVVKMAMGSEGGKGVFFLPGDQFDQVEGRIRHDIVIQRPIRQHPQLAAVNASSVNTIRLISLLRQGQVKVYSGILRIGQGGARVDNASSGGITCGITPEGKLKTYAYNTAGERFTQHPDTGLVFAGHAIPGYADCVAAVEKLHVQVPHFRLVSWDFSVTETGEPLLIEANLYFGQLDFHQLNNGPLFGADTQEILAEVLGK